MGAKRVTIRFKCVCRQSVRVSGEHAGKKGRCPACGAILRIPRDSGAPAHVEISVIWALRLKLLMNRLCECLLCSYFPLRKWGEILSIDWRALLVVLPLTAGLLVSLILWLYAAGPEALHLAIVFSVLTGTYGWLTAFAFFFGRSTRDLQFSLDTLRHRRRTLRQDLEKLGP